MIKILHIADVHLGYSYRSKNNDLRRLLEGSIEKSFVKAREFAINNEIDLFIIAGDLFDYGPIGPRTFDFFIDQVRRLKSHGIEVAYALGNHDNLTLIQDNLMEIFRREMIVFDKANVVSKSLLTNSGESYKLHGVGHEFDRMDENLIKNYPSSDKSVKYNIGISHCYVESSLSSSGYDKYLPTTYSDLLGKSYDYFALGHIHLPSVHEDATIAYSGSLQALSFKEEGERGGNYVEIDEFGTTIKHINFSSKLYRNIDVKIDPKERDHLELINYIVEIARRELASIDLKNTLVRINLIGYVNNSVMNLLVNENKYIAETLSQNLLVDYVVLKIDEVNLDYKSENALNQKHFLSYAIEKYDEDKEMIRENLIYNLKKNGLDLNSIDLDKYIDEIKENMIQSIIRR